MEAVCWWSELQYFMDCMVNEWSPDVPDFDAIIKMKDVLYMTGTSGMTNESVNK